MDNLTESILKELFETLYKNPKSLDNIQPATELLSVLKAITRPSTIPYFHSEERKIDSFIRWLKGRKLQVADKKELTVAGTAPADITSSSLAIRFLKDLLAIFKELDLCDGIVLLFDEFEEIFEGLSRARQSRYAQDLRHLFDTLNELVFFVLATIPEPRDLGQYPPISRRLGNIRELQPIIDSEMATSYVLDYLNTERDKYETECNVSETQPTPCRPEENALDPLTQDDVDDVFLSLKKEAEEGGLDVLPGYFLPRIRERTEKIVKRHS